MRRSCNKRTHAKSLHVGVTNIKKTQRHSNHFRRLPLHGFTLVELLVVVGIISLLVAILLPSLTSARIAAQRVVCKTNLRQLAFGWEMYLQDNKDTFYRADDANLNYGGWKGHIPGWDHARVLNKYLNFPAIMQTPDEAGIFVCPADRGGAPGVTLDVYQEFGTSYQTNLYLVGRVRPPAAPFVPHPELFLQTNKILERGGVKRNAIAEPARLLLIGDYGWINQWSPVHLSRTEWHHRPCHHNVAFMDSHVEFLHVRKGLFVTPDYRVLPFKSLDSLAYEVQEEKLCEN